MAGRRLYEILREEQEPFALQSFIRERRRQLHPLARLRSCSSVRRRSLFSCLAHSRIPFFLSLHHGGSRRKRKKKKKKGKWGPNGREDGPVTGIVGFLAKKLFARKRNSVAGGLTDVSPIEQDNEGNCFSVSVEAKEEEASESEVVAVSCRCGQPECPLYDGGGISPPVPDQEAKAAILTLRSPEFASSERFCEGVAEKQQLSPVSVLDQLFDEEEECPHSRREEEDESFQDRLAALERTKQELLLKICSFERLAVDLHEEADGCPEPEKQNSVGRRRMELWKGADSEIARRMVEADQRGERGDLSWRPELAAELSSAVFSALVYDLTVDLAAT